MTVKSFKIFTISIVVAALAAIGIVTPAQSATMTSVTASTTSALVAGQPNAAAITVTFTTPTALVAGVNTQLNVYFTGASGLTPSALCSSTSPATTFTSSTTAPSSCSFLDASTVNVSQANGAAAGTTWTLTLAAGALTMPATGTKFQVSMNSRNHSATAQGGSVSADSGFAFITYPGMTSTATFNANGGAGTVAAQTASAATALTSNAFTKDGFTFTGWNTAADGTGAAYADGASYAFTADVTLYAQWKAVLAKTGFDGAPYLLVGNLLGVLGVAVLLMAARRRQTS